MSERNVKLEYFDGQRWLPCGWFFYESAAWMSLGSDNENYRTVDKSGKVLTDNSRRHPMNDE